MPAPGYSGSPRMYPSAVRTMVAKDEPHFEVEVTVLSRDAPVRVTLELGQMAVAMQRAVDPITHGVHSQVYRAQIVAPEEDFEYRLLAELPSGQVLRWPILSNQTVVVV